MPLYKNDNAFGRAKKTYDQAAATMGKQTREGPRTEYEAVRPSAGQFLAQGVGLLGTGEAAWKYGNKAYDWLAGLGAPDAAEQAATAGAGAAQAGVTDGLLGSVQLNTGAQAVGSGAAGAMNMGQAEAMRNIGPMAPEMTSGLGEGAAEAGAGAATQGQSALAWGPMAGSAIGGVAGSMGGKALGQAIAGDTGGKVGGVVGGAAGGYLGGLAGTALTGTAGAAGGAAAGATAGSVVPGVGTLVGAGIGALTSLFF